MAVGNNTRILHIQSENFLIGLPDAFQLQEVKR